MIDLSLGRDPIVIENDEMTDVRSFFHESALKEVSLTEQDVKRYLNTHCGTSVFLSFQDFMRGMGKFTDELAVALRPVLQERVVTLRRLQIISDWEIKHRRTHSGNWIQTVNGVELAEF